MHPHLYHNLCLAKALDSGDQDGEAVLQWPGLFVCLLLLTCCINDVARASWIHLYADNTVI